MHDLAEVVRDEAVVLGQGTWMNLGNLPSRKIAVKPVDECFYLEEIGKRLEQVVVLLVRQFRLDVDIADHHDGGEGQNFLFTPAEFGVLHVALHDRHQGFWVGEVGVGDLIEHHRITTPDHADLAVGVIDKEARRGCLSSRENRNVVALIAVDVRFACFPGSKFDAVVVGLDHRHEPPQVKQLFAPGHRFRIQANRVDEEVQPLARLKVLPLVDVFVDVDDRNLERCELRDFEGADLFVVDLGFVVRQGDGSPHATRQQHWVLPNEAFGNVDEALVDGRDGAPILVFGLLEPDFQVGDDFVVAGLPNLVTNLLGLGSVDEVLPQALDYLLQIVMKVLLAAVVVDQVFDDETRKLIDSRIDGESLVDDLAAEDVFEASIHDLVNAARQGPCP